MLMVRKMAEEGLFGDITYAECGYVHDCRSLAFDGEGKLTWRGEMARDHAGNLYPTHDLGPIAKCIGHQPRRPAGVARGDAEPQ